MIKLVKIYNTPKGSLRAKLQVVDNYNISLYIVKQGDVNSKVGKILEIDNIIGIIKVEFQGKVSTISRR